MLSANQIDEKHEKLKVLIERCNIGNEEDYEESLRSLFAGTD